MLLKDTFLKDIYRPIDPVVKANELGHLRSELEEFVITNEAKSHLQRFFDEYNDPDSAGNGAWISGFFGSGKSHLLKIMAVVMEDRRVDGKGAMDYILPKLADTPALASAMEQSRLRHPSESVLFNIDSFAPNAGRSEAGAILSAFIKAFNHHCGYFDGDQQHIAKLEYDLDREGHLGAFKARVEELCGKPWEQVRSSSLLYGKKITAAFDEVCGNPEGTTANVISYYQQTYKPDIRMFAQRVKAYIDEHEKGFRLNFFVDEVGQFIAQNTSLMVNLQTIAEELDNFCHGDSWVIVTSQENVEDVVGQMKQISANDFSKIKDRFKTRMVLTSSDAKEVIRDRLLAKHPEDEPFLEEMYEKYRADFDVLFDFADGAKRYRQYQDIQEFCGTYPFVPYQFEVFMTALRGLSDHNCFTGRHNSTGARSMLGVFQMVAQRICDAGASTEQGTLAPFDMMFEGLRNDLKSEVYAAISTAEDQLDDETAIRLLKALLLVKYCQDFRATPGNLRVLLYGSFGESTSELNTKIQTALDTLEDQVYVRRNGNIYEYLTNDEKEVEKEIANTIVPEVETRKQIAELFKDVCGATRVTYRNGSFEHSYLYNLKIDGEAQGMQKNDLTVDVVTERDDGGLFGDIVPTPPKTLTIELRNCREFLLGVRTFKQTETYTGIHSGAGEIREAILHDKQVANGKLYARLKEELARLLSDARYNAGGVDITGQVTGTAGDAVQSATQELVRRSYTGLQQIGQKLTDNDVYTQCFSSETMLGLPEYCETVLSRIRLTKGAVASTVAGDGAGSLTGYFIKNEYGWPEVSVRSAIARLFAANKVEIRKSGSPLDTSALADALKRKRDLDKLVVSIIDEVSPEDIAALSRSFKLFAGTQPKGSDQKAIASELAEVAASHAKGFRATAASAHAYPFGDVYETALQKVEECAKNASDWRWALGEFPAKAQEYADAMDDLRKMAAFAGGSPMGKRWNELKAFAESDAGYLPELGIDDERAGEIRAIVEDPGCFKSGGIPQATKQMEALKKEAGAARASLRGAERRKLAEYRASYEDTYDMTALPQEAADEFDALFSEAEGQLELVSIPYKIKSFSEDFKRRNAARLLALVNPAPEPPETPPDEPPIDVPPVYVPKTVPVARLSAKGYGKPAITSEKDADEYLAALKASIVAVLSDGDIVSI